MTRVRAAVVLFVCSLIAAGGAALAVADPFHLRYAPWFTAGLVLLAVVLFTAALAVGVRRGLLRGLVLAVGTLAVIGWVYLVWVVSSITGPGEVVSEAADGDRRLVVLREQFTIDLTYAVVLRSGAGPFAQQTVVYQGLEDAPPPSDVRFVDSDTVEVRTDGGCVYRSEVEPLTLAVDPVHRPLVREGC